MSDSHPSPDIELQALLDAAVDAIILIDHLGIVTVFSAGAEKMFGYAAHEIVGTNVKSLMTDPDGKQHDSQLERFQRTGTARIIGIGREVNCRRKDSSVFPAHLSVGRIGKSNPARFVGVLHDMTLRHQALTSARRERDRANSYLEAAQTILIALDLSYRITLINRKGCEVLGVDENTLLGTDWLEMAVVPEQRVRAAKVIEAMISNTPRLPCNLEYRIRARDSAERLIVWRCVVLEDDEGNVIGVLCSGDDVTVSRQAEQDAREARERMMHVARLSTMGEMASGISHELNQPLTAITNYAHAARRLLAAQSADPEDVNEALEQIAAQALRAGEIIRRLRNLVKNRESHREPADINEVIEELDSLTRADARANDVRIVLLLQRDLPPMVLDRVQIQQVLLNLLRNGIDALEAMPAEEREIIIRTYKSPTGDVVIEVADTGPGVDAAMLPTLFMPFATSKNQGTGLGLAISRTIMEAHKGRLGYRANHPHGAIFALTLQVEQEPST